MVSVDEICGYDERALGRYIRARVHDHGRRDPPLDPRMQELPEEILISALRNCSGESSFAKRLASVLTPLLEECKGPIATGRPDYEAVRALANLASYLDHELASSDNLAGELFDLAVLLEPRVLAPEAELERLAYFNVLRGLRVSRRDGRLEYWLALWAHNKPLTNSVAFSGIYSMNPDRAWELLDQVVEREASDPSLLASALSFLVADKCGLQKILGYRQRLDHSKQDTIDEALDELGIPRTEHAVLQNRLEPQDCLKWYTKFGKADEAA